MSLYVICCCYIVRVDETRHRCVASHNDGQRKRRSDKPFAEEIATQGRPSVVQDSYIEVVQLDPGGRLRRTIDRESFFKLVRVERGVIFRVENLQGAKKEISLIFPIPVSARTATHPNLYA